MDVTLVGEGPAADAVRAALADVDATVARGEPDAVADADLGVVVGRWGDATFGTADERARRAGVPWLAVEAGGLGDYAVDGLRASVAGFGPTTGCRTCLRARVAANRGDEADGAAAPDPSPADVRLAGALAGRAAVRLLDGERGAVLGRVVEVPHASRAFLPVPGCPVCGDGDDGRLALTHADRDLETSLAAAERALDERVGLVHEVGEIESFPAPYYLARAAETTGFSDAQAAEQAAGVAADWNTAFMKALGESLERYAAGVYRTDAMRRARPGDVEGTVSPAAFVGVDDAGVDPIPWVPGRELRTPEGGTRDDAAVGNEAPDDAEAAGSGTEKGAPGDVGRAGESSDGDPVADAGRGTAAGTEGGDPTTGGSTDVLGPTAWLPAEFVQFPPPERRFGRSITTGLGLESGTVGALLSGLYEVVERDATMLSWYSTYEPLRLAVDDEAFEELAARARGVGLSVTPLLVTQDVDVPVVAVAVHREGDWPQFAVGSGADLDATAAARSALAEALQNWMELRAMGPEGAAGEAGAIGRYADFPRAAREFVDVDAAVPAASVGPDPVPRGREELAGVVSRVRAAGLVPYAAGLTPRDVRSLGFEAVRVLVPSAQPLFTGEPTFGERARTVPAELGFEPRLDRSFHPFP